jgi:acyl-CoA thioester hydrolase
MSDGDAEFRLDIEVQPDDVDELGHVNNIVYVRWLQDVAVAHSTAVGLDPQAYQRLGGAFIVRKHEIEYLAPAFLGERIALCTTVAWFRAATTERRTRVLRASDGAQLARASTLWAFVTSDGGRPRRIPPEVRQPFGFGGD